MVLSRPNAKSGEILDSFHVDLYCRQRLSNVVFSVGFDPVARFPFVAFFGTPGHVQNQGGCSWGWFCPHQYRILQKEYRFDTRQILRIYILLDLYAASYHYILEVAPL